MDGATVKMSGRTMEECPGVVQSVKVGLAMVYTIIIGVREIVSFGIQPIQISVASIVRVTSDENVHLL